MKLPDSLGERMDEDLLADLLHIASGWALLRAIDGACHGYPVGDPEPWDDRGFMPRVAVTQEVRQILIGAGMQAIRYRDGIGDWWLGAQAREVGPLYFILDQSVLRVTRAEALSTLAAHLVGLADAAADTPAQTLTPGLASGQARGR